MPLDMAQLAGFGGAWETMRALVGADGSAASPAVWRLARPTTPLRDLADTAHYLCMLHGNHPGVIDHSAERTAATAAQAWLNIAATAFAEERAYLAAITAAAGGPPSTPGQAETETAVIGQHHALDMLAQSDRTGCALGAAVALALDWRAIRQVLDGAAERLGLETPSATLPPEHESAALIAAMAESLAVERAMLFGADQLLLQHRGLWDLLQARSEAREQD